MKPTKVTFTGIDERTDVKRLVRLQKKYPFVEFGVLTSYNWDKNGNRYLPPQLIPSLHGCGLNLSLHLCGSLAHDAAEGCWNRVNHHVCNSLDAFKRVQLNVAQRSDNPIRIASTPNRHTELIIQQTADNTSLYEASAWVCCGSTGGVSLLLDASGGRGIDTPLEVWESTGKIGYAGGFNPDNIAEKLSFLMQNIRKGEFWIDMESGVRSDDWLDLDKVEQVLVICDYLIKLYSLSK